MDFLFENLGPERFQQFCHALIAKEFPYSQALPVGQRDGGRDSIAYSMDSTKKEFAVFQVKYVREPQKIQDVHKFLKDILADEIPKIKKLLPRGAKEYFLLTNVKGTSFFEKGSIDLVNDLLEKSLPIPSICWWRDDLIGKLESNHDLKWSYPELLSGKDVLQATIFDRINENKERREMVLKAYLADQYEIDSEVKFKQIELQNNLFDLFIDVPIRLKDVSKEPKRSKALKEIYPFFTRYSNYYYSQTHESDEELGASFFLLNVANTYGIDRILIEGGPGQGKSTITQYVCQVHRIRLLNKTYDFFDLPAYVKTSPLRLPFKIDLRDLAEWSSKKNPYPDNISDEYFQAKWQNSLESFLIAHIFYHSKIENFDANDLLAVCKTSALLIVFDGFDEIADLKQRENIIDIIYRGINRIKENSKSLQVIVTSRPAAFINSAGFSKDLFPHFELSDITPKISKDYVQKWIKSKRLNQRDASTLLKIVDEKLKLSHIKELAKSPMQLAILMSLLNTRGESLPNKRTALYDSYIELFFNRESEKNTVIRDKRDLIINMHQYLGWSLHSEAELFKNSGRIEIDKLILKLKSYLDSEGHKTEIADELFTVIQERVCALVSRVQGTFEFEVQPLREYFSAKYLYNTSPYSPAGDEKKGTKPERFDALSKNYYWQNVLRFFAGCFDRGELPMLIQKLKDLQEDEYFKYTNYPRLITSQLLSDWVFAQYPKLLRDVIQIIIDGINIGTIFNQSIQNIKTEPISLPKECGRDIIVEEAFRELMKLPSEDYAFELIGLINNNPSNIEEQWIAHSYTLNGTDLTKWFQYGYYLQILYKLQEKTIIDIFEIDHNYNFLRLQTLINSNRLDVINNNSILKKKAIEGILDAEISILKRMVSGDVLATISYCLNCHMMTSLIQESFPAYNFREFLYKIAPRGFYEEKMQDELQFTIDVIKDDEDKRLATFFKTINEIAETPISSWKTTIYPWDKLVEGGRSIYGEKWSFNLISIIAAGIKSSEEKFNEFDDLNDPSVSLCKRVRNARLKSGNISWWKQQLRSSKNDLFNLTVFFTWGTPNTMENLIEILEEKISKLTDDEIAFLYNNLLRVSRLQTLNEVYTKRLLKTIKNTNVSDSLKLLLSIKFQTKSGNNEFNKFIKNYNGDNQTLIKIKLDALLSGFFSTPSQSTLASIKSCYKKLNRQHNTSFYFGGDFHNTTSMIPYDLAKEIMIDNKNIPRILVILAERNCRAEANKIAKAVGKIAIEDDWFVE